MAIGSVHYYVAEAGKLNRLCDKKSKSIPAILRIEDELENEFLKRPDIFPYETKERAFILKAVLNAKMIRMLREK